jgi:GAF domain-containing protein
MTSLLGVPVRTRSTVFGALYLADRRGGGAFSEEDEQLVLALAATAGVAIENARLYEEAQVRQDWLRAAGEVDQVLLAADVDDREALRRVATSVQRLTKADVVVVVLPSATTVDQLEVVVAAGLGAARLTGLRYVADESLAWRAVSSSRAVRSRVGVEELTGDPLRAVLPLTQLMAVPMSGDSGTRGAVVAGRLTGAPFSGAELDLAETFARRAAVALDLADARSSQQRLSLLEERGRIAFELHDQVIQRLFATGLSMQGLEMALPPGELQSRTSAAIEDLDETISRIQATITTLRDPERTTPQPSAEARPPAGQPRPARARSRGQDLCPW